MDQKGEGKDYQDYSNIEWIDTTETPKLLMNIFYNTF